MYTYGGFNDFVKGTSSKYHPRRRPAFMGNRMVVAEKTCLF